TRVVDAFQGAIGAQPDALAEFALWPVLHDLGHLHDEYSHVTNAAPFFVEIAAHRLLAQDADQAGLFPRLLKRGFARGLARFNLSFGNDPAFAVAGSDETDSSVPNRKRCSLEEEPGVVSHRGVP